MNWLSLFIAAIFALFAYFQLNDPDPERWVILYGAMALLWVAAAFDRYFLPLIYIVLLASAIWMISLLPDFIDWLQTGAESIVGSMKAEQPHIELTREFLGLLIVIFALESLRRKARRKQNPIGKIS